MTVNIEDLPEGMSLPDFIGSDLARREIKRRFCHFLKTFTDESDRPVYKDRVKRMCDANKQSLEVSYMHLSNAQPVFGIWVADAPEPILEALNEAAFEVVLALYPNYQEIHNEVFVRIIELPITDKLRDIRQVHLNALVKVGGVVTRRTAIYPQLKMVMFDCGKCGYRVGPFYQSTGSSDVKPNACPECQSKGPFSVNQEQTIYRNYQKMTLQETPGTVPAGRLPRYKDVILLGDLIDCARPGEQVEVTGIYKNNFDASLNTKNGFPVFATVIEANHISKKDDIYSPFRLTEEDEEKIKALSKEPGLLHKITQSVAPSIFGHDDIRTALALSMFGGQPKDIQNKHRIRGDINVLLLGDPGTAKSQFLKYVEKSMSRAVFTTGKGASAVGLTAGVHLDPITREWTLEGGALVLADTGVCLIDEFDKMSDQDRTSIHEAMEQQTISISKAGIVTTLQARCAVIAAANPKSGRYNSSLHFHENVELTEPILSRFDVLCVVKDLIDPILDTQLADFVVRSHANSHPSMANDEEESNGEGEGPIPQSLLKKYIVYAKKHVKPTINNIDKDKVIDLYAKLRQESEAGGGIPIAVRHMESIIRMSEAFARMHLRSTVRDDDVNMAIRVMLDSFISSQKYGVQRALRRQFQRYLAFNKDNNELLFYLLQSMVRDELQFARSKNVLGLREEEEIVIDRRDFEARAAAVGVHSYEDFYACKMFTSRFVHDAETAAIRRVPDDLASPARATGRSTAATP
jgi:DNA replication licensing factor MCM2